MEAAHWTTELP